jgi:hypothetical protein
MEIGQGPNWVCSAKRKKKVVYNIYIYIILTVQYIEYRPTNLFGRKLHFTVVHSKKL